MEKNPDPCCLNLPGILTRCCFLPIGFEQYLHHPSCLSGTSQTFLLDPLSKLWLAVQGRGCHSSYVTAQHTLGVGHKKDPCPHVIWTFLHLRFLQLQIKDLASDSQGVCVLEASKLWPLGGVGKGLSSAVRLPGFEPWAAVCSACDLGPKGSCLSSL